MNWLNLIVNLFFSFIGVVLALWYENLGSPRLIIKPGETTDGKRVGDTRARFLHVIVENKPRKVPFVPRQTAMACHGTITFTSLSSKPVGNTISIKWDGTPEPLKPEIIDDEIKHLLDNRLIRTCGYIDIPPDEEESLAMAIRIQVDSEAYGWTAASYGNDWRYPNSTLPLGTYIAQVKIFTGDDPFQEKFRFENPSNFEGFDLVKVED